MTLGRWGIELIERLNYFIAIPTIATVSCLFTMALATVFLVDLFEMKSKLSTIITATVVAVSPCLMVTLLYVYTSFAYCFAFLSSILTIWSVYKLKNRCKSVFFGSIFFMLTLSIYQSYIGVAVGLCCMLTALDLLKCEKNIKEILINVLTAVITVFVGAILYYFATIIILNVLNLELSVYRGANNISILTILSTLNVTFIETYRDCFHFFFRDDITFNTIYKRDTFYTIFFFGMACLIAFNMIKNRPNNKKQLIIRWILTFFAFLMVPVCLNIVDILVSATEMYLLTSMQMLLIIPMTMVLIEMTDGLKIMQWVTILSVIPVIASYYVADNTSYAAIKLTYNQAYSITARIIDRVENTPGYDRSMRMLFGGIIGDYNYSRSSKLYNYTVGYLTNYPVFHISYNGQNDTWRKFIKVFFGLDYEVCTPEQYVNILNSDQYREMEIFPASNSVQIIDDIVVIKLTENPERPF